MLRPKAILLLAGLIAIGLARPLTAQTTPDAWSMLAERFVLTECTSGGTADRWANHYADHPRYMQRVLGRAELWIAYIANEIERRGLPGELALLPIAESGFDPFAYSRRDAAGIWQLLAETGRLQDLEINDWYDGRRDTYAATGAALNYLEHLHARLNGRWDLAIAAYNAGPSRVARNLRAADHGDGKISWQALSLPGETRVYLSRITGLACLFTHPQRYGLERPTVRPEKPFIPVEVNGPVDVVAFAASANLQPRELLELNAGLRGLFTPPEGPHYLLVPADSGDRARAAAAAIPPATVMTWSRQNERRRDSLIGIARRHDASVTALKKLNGLGDAMPRIGQQLIVPPPSSQPRDPEYGQRLNELMRLQAKYLPEKRHRHRVRAGENLWALSQRYSVPIDTIRRTNGLSPNGHIRPGQMIEIPPGPSALKPNQYQVQPGDTLWSISREHGISVNDLRALNAITLPKSLKPGDILYVGEDKCCGNIARFISP